MKTKKFDCVQMKRLGAAKVREQTATLTREQELAFWRVRSKSSASAPSRTQSPHQPGSRRIGAST